jgi:rhamnogalacturonan endolyase
MDKKLLNRLNENPHQLSILIIIFFFFEIFANNIFSARIMEKLNRGVVAVRTDANHVYIGWRMFGTDPKDVSFNIYRNGTKINSTPITNSTNYIDTTNMDGTYTIKTVINGVEQEESEGVGVWQQFYKIINLNVPPGGTTPDGVSYTYSPNDCSVGDLDGDGEYEIVLKWDPSNSKDNSQSGYTGNVYLDAYKLNGTFLWRIDLGINIRAGAHYTQFLVYDFDSDGKAEIMCKTAPGTKDGKGVFLHTGPAANDDDSADYRNSSGYILSGPEYLTVFRGIDGAEIITVNYQPPRGTVSSWGDNYGNRVDRFLACVAYLDGVHPSAVFQRGYYTRMTLAAWDFNGTNLTLRWFFDSNNGYSNFAGQGNHNLSVGDVDGDGFDEIIEGACAIDHDGKGMYATGLGHGDAIHLGDLDPNRPGLEVWEVHENTSSPYGYEMHDARTGQIIWGAYTGTDNGRGLAADIDNGYRGYEMWSASGAGTFSNSGTQISTSKPTINFRIYWDGDLQDELLDGTKLDKWTGNGTTRLISFYNYNAQEINGTKANPNLVADILGDWREEAIYRSSDNSKLIIFTTTTLTNYKFYTLMHDKIYRLAIAWQNVAYNQPPHPSFYLGDGPSAQPTANIIYPNTNLTPTKTYTPTLTNTSTFTATRTFTKTNTPTPTNTMSNTATLTNTTTFTATKTFTNTITPTPTNTNTTTLTNTQTKTFTLTFTNTPTNTISNTTTFTTTKTFTNTGTSTPTNTISNTATLTNTQTKTFTLTFTTTPTNTISNTATLTNTSTFTATRTFTNTITLTSINSNTATRTFTATFTSTYTVTETNTQTTTQTNTNTMTITKTWTATATNTNTVTTTITNTATATMTRTGTNTATPSWTKTSTPTMTNSATGTKTATPTFTETVVAEKEEFKIENIKLYPNPYNLNKGDLKIRFEITQASKEIKIKVYTTGYRLIAQVTKEGNYVVGRNVIELESWNLRKISNGTYYIVITAINKKGESVNSKPVVLIVLR